MFMYFYSYNCSSYIYFVFWGPYGRLTIVKVAFSLNKVVIIYYVCNLI